MPIRRPGDSGEHPVLVEVDVEERIPLFGGCDLPGQFGVQE